MTEEKADGPKVKVGFIFIMCNDVGEIRHFYTDLLGMNEVAFFGDENFGYINYKCEGFEFMFFHTGTKMPVIDKWTWQPGYDGGEYHAISWAIAIPEKSFGDVVEKLKRENVKLFSDKPEWRQGSYWGFSVMDPMGNTVEVYTMPAEKPSSTEWL